MILFYWIIEYVASFIEAFICCVFCGTFIYKEKELHKKRYIFIVSLICAGIAIMLNNVKIFSYINSMLILLMCIICQWIIYKKRKALAVLLVTIFFVIVSSIDFSVVYLIADINDTSANNLLAMHSITRVVCILLSKSILILVVMTINKILNRSRFLPKKYIIIMSFCSLFLFISNFIMVQTNINNKSDSFGLFLTIFFIASLGIELLLFYFIIKIGENYEQKQKIYLTEMKNAVLQNSLNETEEAFKLWRKSVHDYKNNVIALTQLANDGELDKIRKYLREEKELINNKLYHIKTGNSVIDAIINTKRNIATEKEINFYVDADIPPSCKIDIMDLANIMGNLIDNALEASENEENSYVSVIAKFNKKFLILKIVNKFTRELPNNLLTTKNDKEMHGIGISSVKSVVEKYNGQFSISKEGNEVCVKVLLLDA